MNKEKRTKNSDTYMSQNDLLSRNNQGRRDHGDQWCYCERPGHDVSGERSAGGTSSVHDDAFFTHRTSGSCWNHAGNGRYYREPCVSSPSLRTACHQRGDDLWPDRPCAGLECVSYLSFTSGFICHFSFAYSFIPILDKCAMLKNYDLPIFW